MSEGRLRIESLREEHLAAVARLHVLRLTRDFSGWAGQAIMRCFYGELMRSHSPPPGFVALLDGRLVGFAVAVPSAREIKKRLLVKWGWWLAILGVTQFVVRPRSLLRRLQRRLTEREPRLAAGEVDALAECCPAPRIEFRGIAMDPAVRVPGAPLALMRARLAWARQAGYRGVYFVIDPHNEASIQLCQWAGAKPVPERQARRQLRYFIVL